VAAEAHVSPWSAPRRQQVGVERAVRGAWLCSLGIADDASLVDVLSGEANIFDGRDVLIRNIPVSLTTMAMYFPTLLRRVVFIG
jgi:hypothetical protein